MGWRINRTFAFPASTVVPLYVPSLPGVTRCVTGNIRWPAVPFFSRACVRVFVCAFRSSNPPGRILRVRRIYVVTFGRDPSVCFYTDDAAAIEQRRARNGAQNGGKHRWRSYERLVVVACRFNNVEILDSPNHSPDHRRYWQNRAWLLSSGTGIRIILFTGSFQSIYTVKF